MTAICELYHTTLLLHLAHEALDSILHKASDGHRTYTTRHGSDSRNLRLDSGEVYITTQLLSLGVTVYTYVNNDCALLNHICCDKLRTADCYDQYVSTACNLCQILSAAVSDSYSCVLVQK